MQPMNNKRFFSKLLPCLLLLMLAGVRLSAQADEDENRPQQFDVLKVNVTQFAINEARILYEFQIGERASLEFGAGYIYPNINWFERGGRQMLATGGGVYFAFRKYFVRKSVFYQPKILSYISPVLFYRFTSYEDEWLLFPGSSPQTSECERFSENINHIGLVIRMGWQTRVGRAVLDFYGGLGFKWQPSTLTSTAINDSSIVCEVISTTDFSTHTIKESPLNVVLNAGVKIGLRRDNRERNYKKRDDFDPIRKDDPQSPPKF